MSQEHTAVSANGDNRQIYDYEYEAVPLAARKSWYVITLIWLAIGIDISGLFLGSFLSSGLTFSNAVSATLIGSALLGVLGVLCANVGYSSGLSTTLLSITIFGRLGGKLVGVISTISLLGWFAFQLDFFGMMLQKALEHYQLAPGRLPILIFGTVLMTSTAVWGVRALGKLSVFSVPLMVLLIVTGLIMAATQQEAPAPMVIAAPITMGMAISYVMSIWILAAVMAPDIARYAKTRKDALLGAGLGFLFGNSATILVALLLTRLVGNDDLVTVFFSIGLGISAILVLVFAQWTTSCFNLISAALGLSVVIVAVSRPVLVVLMAFIGLGLAYYGMIENFTSFLSLLGVLISPIAGVYLVEFYAIDAERVKRGIMQELPALNVTASLAWFFGSLVSLLTAEDFFNLFSITSISAIDGVLAAMLAYGLLHKISPNRTK